MLSEKKILFIQPIVSHYRKSLVEEIIKLEPDSTFWGTDDFLGVAPLTGIDNVKNDFDTFKIRIKGKIFVWYKGMIARFLKDDSTHVVISGFNPLLLQTVIIFFITKWFTKKKVYWWSQGKKFNQGFLGKKIRYFLYKNADGIFLYSKQGKENFLREGLDEKKLHVINNSLNDEDYGFLNYKLESSEAKKEFRIVYSGRLSQRKKVIVLLEALKHLKNRGMNDIYADIIGDGEQMTDLKNYAKEADINSIVHFHGGKYGFDVHPYFLNGDLYVIPGAVGLSIVHAFSFGLPALTGKGDAAHSTELELLVPGQTGDYFELDNSEDLADKILFWRDKILQEKNKYCNNCVQSIVNKEYLPGLVAEKLVNAL